MSSTTSSSEIGDDSDETEVGLRRSGMFGLYRANDVLRASRSTASEEDDDSPTLFDSRKALARELIADRYESRSILGEGGMGEVRLVWDRVVGREVAMKVLLPERAGKARARERFLREGHVQAYLDHPAIVPVHEVGTLPTGEPFFTMKRVRGVTLLEVLEGLRRSDPKYASRFDRQRLLAAFAKACLAIDYAHARGVVHRDLKPENVMVGDFGEVYVLDWGVARIVGTQVQRMPMALLGSITRGDRPDPLGTPGYMAPEQIEQPNDVDASADVYSLGAILFELLTLAPLHTGRSVPDLLISTREGGDARCSVRAPEADVPSELEALCVRATHSDPLKRPQVREIHEALESFLDGAREAERRQLVADLHLRAAKETMKRASEAGPSRAALQRDAIRGLARALAADPRNQEALRRLLDALAQPIEGELPPEAEAALRQDEERERRVASRVLRMGRISWLVYVPFVTWMGIRDPVLVGLATSAVVASSSLSWLVDRLPRQRPWMRTGVAMFAMLTMMPIATLFSPVILLPTLLAASIPAFMVNLDRAGRILAILTACLAATLPLVLETVGAIPPSVRVEGGVITILPRMVEYSEGPTLVVLALFAMTPIATSALLMARVRTELDAARRRIHGHLWRLRQLMP